MQDPRVFLVSEWKALVAILAFAMLSCFFLNLSFASLNELTSGVLNYVLIATFILFFALVVFNRKDLLGLLRAISKKHAMLLVLICSVSFLLSLYSGYCSVHDIVFFEYSISSKSMLYEGNAIFLHPQGYSIALLPLFIFEDFFGAVLIFLALASAATTLVVFLITKELFRSPEAAILSSMVFALNPGKTMFTQILAPQALSMLFVSLTFLFLISATGKSNPKAWLLPLVSLVVAISIRIENIMFLSAFFFSWIVYRKGLSIQSVKWPFILFLFLSLQFSHFYIHAEDHFGSETFPELRGQNIPLFSVSSLGTKLPVYFSELFLNVQFYSILLPFFIAPLILYRKDMRFILLYFSIVVALFVFSMRTFTTSPGLYLSVLMPMMSVLIGSGLFLFVSFTLELRHSITSKQRNILLASLTAIVVLSFSLGTATFNKIELPCQRDCLNSQIRCMLSGLEENSCVLVDKSGYIFGGYVMKVGGYVMKDVVSMISSREVKDSLDDVRDCGSIYYLNLTMGTTKDMNGNTINKFDSVYGKRIPIFDDQNMLEKIDEKEGNFFSLSLSRVLE